MRRLLIAVVFLAALVGAGVTYENFHLAAAPPRDIVPAPPPRVPVIAAAVVRKPVPVQVAAIGTVQPIKTVVVKSRIDGQIVKVAARDGQEVKAGDTLFQLDSRAIEAQIRQAEAQLARDRAQLANARREADRQGELASKSYASASVADTSRTNAAALEATVRADEAGLENMRVQLTYYTIATPIDGRAGAIALKEGNNVKANDTITLLTVNQMHPIYVAFSVPQNELPAIRAAMGQHDVEVAAQASGVATVEKGKLAFIDNAVDSTTGTIVLKGVFDNQRSNLWPGQYVNAVLTLRVDDALVIPSQAVQVGQDSNFVYVVKADMTVEPRPLKVTRSAGGESVVTGGLEEGETIVVDGQLRLTKGTRVELRPAPAPSGAAAGPTS